MKLFYCEHKKITKFYNIFAFLMVATAFLLVYSSCAAPTDQTLNGDTGETTVPSNFEEPTSPDISAKPTFIASDLNDDSVEEKIAIDTSSESATIQIKQTKDGGDLTLADISFLPSVSEGGDSSELHSNSSCSSPVCFSQRSQRSLYS